jgi:hypothetical protein
MQERYPEALSRIRQLYPYGRSSETVEEFNMHRRLKNGLLVILSVDIDESRSEFLKTDSGTIFPLIRAADLPSDVISRVIIIVSSASEQSVFLELPVFDQSGHTVKQGLYNSFPASGTDGILSGPASAQTVLRVDQKRFAAPVSPVIMVNPFRGSKTALSIKANW